MSTQFSTIVATIQCDNGREFDNALLRNSATTHGTLLWFCCPYMSQRNGKVEHVIRTVNNIVRSLLFQASMPPHYWVEALHATTLLLNILPTKVLKTHTPYFSPFQSITFILPSASFWVSLLPQHRRHHAQQTCTPLHSICLLGYSSTHKGYHCMDLST